VTDKSQSLDISTKLTYFIDEDNGGLQFVSLHKKQIINAVRIQMPYI